MRQFLLFASIAMLAACTPPKNDAYTKYKKTDIQVTEHTPVVIEAVGQDKVMFLGQMIDAGNNSTKGAMLYPGATGEMFLASIITHAVLEKSMGNSAKSKLAEQSNKVLIPYASVLDNFSTKSLLQDSRALIHLDDRFDVIDGKTSSASSVVKDDQQSKQPWVVRSKPVYFMTQDEQAVILKNVIEIYSNKKQKKPIYTNIAEVISSGHAASKDASSYWLEGNPPRLRRESIELFSESIEIAVTDLLSKLSDSPDKEITFKLDQGGKTVYERGYFVAKNENRTTIRTLRGWLKSMPSESLIELSRAD